LFFVQKVSFFWFKGSKPPPQLQEKGRYAMRRFKQEVCSRSAVVAILIVGAVLIVSRANADPITYSLVSYPDGQNGNSISGTITTDGNLGYIGAAVNISSITITLSGYLESSTPDVLVTSTATYTNPTIWGGSLLATPTSLSVPDEGAFSINPANDPAWLSYSPYVPVPQMYWWNGQQGPQNISGVTPPGNEPGYVYAAIAATPPESGSFYWCDIWATDPTPWVSPGYTVGPSEMGYEKPMLIATAVPEPSTFALLGIGAVSLLAYAWRRRKGAT